MKTINIKMEHQNLTSAVGEYIISNDSRGKFESREPQITQGNLRKLATKMQLAGTTKY